MRKPGGANELRGFGSIVARRVRRFPSDESGSSEVESILILALVVMPLTAIIPIILIKSFTEFFGRVGWWINLPFP